LLAAEATSAWGEWVAGLREWHVFGGLTFDQRRFQVYRCKVPAFDGGMFGESTEAYVVETPLVMPKVVARDVAIGRFQRWVRRCETALGRRVDYVAALQYQRNGWPHFHPLLDVGRLVDGDIAIMGRLWYEENGYGRLEVPRDLEAVAKYASRYLVRDMADGDVLLSRLLGHKGEFCIPF